MGRMTDLFCAIEVDTNFFGRPVYRLHGKRISRGDYVAYRSSFEIESQTMSRATARALADASRMAREYERGSPPADAHGFAGYRNDAEIPPYLNTANWGNFGGATRVDEPDVEARIRKYQMENAGRPDGVGFAGMTDRDRALLPEWERGNWGAC